MKSPTFAFTAFAVVVGLAACEHKSTDTANEGTTVAASNADGRTTYRAIGQEPGWTLTISGGALKLNYNYGEDKITAPLQERQLTDGVTRYRAKADEHELNVTIYDEVCTDVMSGQNYPDRVEVMINDNKLSGCGGAPTDLLTGDEWVVEDIDGKGVIDMTRTMIKFDPEGRISGNGGCNNYSGSYALTGEGLSFGPIAATKKACVPALMAQEQLFFDVLAGVARFEIAGDGALVLSGNDQRTILARR